MKSYPEDFPSHSLLYAVSVCVCVTCHGVWVVLISYVDIRLSWAFGSDGSPYGSLSGFLSTVKNDPSHTRPWPAEPLMDQNFHHHVNFTLAHTHTDKSTLETRLIITRTIYFLKSIFNSINRNKIFFFFFKVCPGFFLFSSRPSCPWLKGRFSEV